MTEICVLTKSSFEEIKTKLINEGFNYVETYNNYDTYFTTLCQNLSNVSYSQLLDKSILVRQIKGENLDKKFIVYKKKVFDKNGNVVDEIKTKLTIDNIEKAKTIFQNVGLFCWCDYIVNNNEFKKDEIIINVQNVNKLGTFIEIEEYESIKRKTNEEKFDILKNIILSMNLEVFPDYSCKKPFMVFKQLLNN